MARKLRVPHYPGGIYHVMAHVLPDTRLYPGERDRTIFLDLFADVLERHGWTCFAWCLMDTHYHALVQIRQTDLDQGMKRLNACYAQGFNRRHGRRGHLFEARYTSVHITADPQFRWTVRYIARNPVEAGICSDPLGWRWSSFVQTVERGGDGVVPTTEVLRFFGGPTRFAAYVCGTELPLAGTKT